MINILEFLLDSLSDATAITGEAFDAEIQMLHTHLDPDPARVSSIGVLIRATAEGYNTEYQQVLNLFQVEYNTHANACRTKQRRHLRRTTPQTTANTNENKDDDLNSTTPVPQQRMDRELYVTDQYRRFNPYAEALMPGIHFYRYDGSITEPPCMSLTWYVHLIVSTNILLFVVVVVFPSSPKQEHFFSF